MKEIPLILLIIILYSSCAKQDNRNFYFKKDTCKTFELDSITQNTFSALHYYQESNNEYLLILSKSRILIFDFKTQKPLKTIKIQDYGKDAINHVNGFQVETLNKFYITNFENCIYVIDSLSKIIQKIDYSSTIDSLPSKLFQARTFINTPLIFIGNKLYLSQEMNGIWGKSGINELRQPICLEIDTISKQIKNLPMHFPLDYFINGNTDVNFSRIFIDSVFIYSFFSDHFLYTTSNHINTKKYNARSKYISDFKGIKKEFTDILEQYRYMLKNPAYCQIIYDRYNKLFYRIVLHPCEFNQNSNLRKLAKYKCYFSILIINKNFEAIGEHFFPNNKYYCLNNFITQDGLWISESHIENPNFDENKLSFRLFKLVKNEN